MELFYNFSIVQLTQGHVILALFNLRISLFALFGYDLGFWLFIASLTASDFGIDVLGIHPSIDLFLELLELLNSADIIVYLVKQ